MALSISFSVGTPPAALNTWPNWSSFIAPPSDGTVRVKRAAQYLYRAKPFVKANYISCKNLCTFVQPTYFLLRRG